MDNSSKTIQNCFYVKKPLDTRLHNVDKFRHYKGINEASNMLLLMLRLLSVEDYNSGTNVKLKNFITFLAYPSVYILCKASFSKLLVFPYY